MTTIALNGIACFQSAVATNSLNQLFQLRKRFMAHEIAGATGCSYDDSVALLLLLFHLGKVRLELVTYHRDHEGAIFYSDFRQGFPTLPIICDLCDKEIIKDDELYYDFAANLLSDRLHFEGR